MVEVYKKKDLLKIEIDGKLVDIFIGFCDCGGWGRLDYPLSKEEALQKLKELKEAIEEAIQKLQSL